MKNYNPRQKYYTVKPVLSRHRIKGATSRMVHLEKNWPIFSSSSFAIRLNLLHPQPSLFLFGLLLPLVFFYLSKLLFWGFLQF